MIARWETDKAISNNFFEYFIGPREQVTFSLVFPEVIIKSINGFFYKRKLQVMKMYDYNALLPKANCSTMNP